MKNSQALFLLLTANVVSGFAQGISMLSIPWYFITILEKPGTFGIVFFSVTAISIFWSSYAGTLIDKYPRKKIFLFISAIGGIFLLSVALYGFITGSAPIALIVAVFALTVFIYNLHYPALYAFGQEITAKADYGRINSYLEIQGQATTIAAGAVGALLLQGTNHETLNLLGFRLYFPFTIEKWQMHEIFLLDACTYFIAIVLIGLIKFTPLAERRPDTGSVYERMKAGLNFLLKNRLIFLFGNASFTIFVILLVHAHFLLPIYVDNYLGEKADVYASSEIFYAVGALLAGLGIRWIFKNTDPVLSIILMMILTVVILLLCFFTKLVGVFYVFSFLIGITNAGTRVLRTTYLFNLIPNDLMGRTGSVFIVINTMFRLLFIAIFSIPFFAYGSNIRFAYLISAIFISFAVLALAKNYKALISQMNLNK